jgi:hypothetical protein
LPKQLFRDKHRHLLFLPSHLLEPLDQ